MSCTKLFTPCWDVLILGCASIARFHVNSKVVKIVKSPFNDKTIHFRHNNVFSQSRFRLVQKEQSHQQSNLRFRFHRVLNVCCCSEPASGSLQDNHLELTFPFTLLSKLWERFQEVLFPCLFQFRCFTAIRANEAEGPGREERAALRVVGGREAGALGEGVRWGNETRLADGGGILFSGYRFSYGENPLYSERWRKLNWIMPHVKPLLRPAEERKHFRRHPLTQGLFDHSSRPPPPPPPLVSSLDFCGECVR